MKSSGSMGSTMAMGSLPQPVLSNRHGLKHQRGSAADLSKVPAGSSIVAASSYGNKDKSSTPLGIASRDQVIAPATSQ